MAGIAKLGPEVAGLVHDVLAVRHATDRVQLYDDANSSALRGWLLSAYDVRACAIEVVWRWLALVQPPGQPHQQQLAAMEALTIYCPLGHALGLGGCSAALEDAAFKVLFPSSYASTARHVLPMSGAAADLLTRCQASLQAAAAADASFQALAGGLQLLSRTKSLYSIMRKLLRLNDPAAGSRRLGEMFDLLGMRAVVLPRKDLPEDEAEAAAVQACYRLQELAHAQWPAVPGRSKDYISKPKLNGYQSLHSTLSMQALQQLMANSSSSSSSGSSVVLSYLELQVRTSAMHAAAEGGDAAHAGYKGRLERRQVRQLQTWTAQLQRRLAGAKQQLLLPLPLPQDGTEADADPAAAEVDAAAATASSSSSILQQTAAVISSGGGSKAMRRKADLRISAASRAPAFRLSSRLVQVLRVWARSEWEQRLFGPARRLWRLAANEAFKFPYDIAAEGGGAVLHAWASAEFERDNVLNARVVIGEALRKCPKDAAVAVLAASIEAAAGEVNAARALFLRAYQLNKADKQLYMQWPRMEGACGNIERARLLFGYGLSLYPSNTKILNLYACFEEQQGEVELARELHQRALGIDAASTTSMHNRVSWAGLELREGNVDEARELLREGLDAHPDFPAALLLLAKLERLEGQLEAAEAYARRAQKASHAFSVAAMGELAAIYAARGDTALAANLGRHLSNVEAATAMKQSGKLHGNQAWASYYRQSAQPQQRQVIEAAWQRKRDLGLIRQPRGAAAAAAGARRQQQQQQQQGEVLGLDFELGGVVESFDFSSAAAAAAAEPPAPEF
ncbi:hypothetical protein OEZ86_005175 [Tetradesmus obliquus]|nr:hypothetical protein OEZ86_005175 [Tetradesmus obliquus]